MALNMILWISQNRCFFFLFPCVRATVRSLFNYGMGSEVLLIVQAAVFWCRNTSKIIFDISLVCQHKFIFKDSYQSSFSAASFCSLSKAMIMKYNSGAKHYRKNCCAYPKIGTLSLYYRVIGPKDADRMANSVDPDQTWSKQCRPWSDCSSIWIYTVCPDLPVRKLRIITGSQLFKIPIVLMHFVNWGEKNNCITTDRDKNYTAEN